LDLFQAPGVKTCKGEKMLKSLEELNKAEIKAGVVVNGVDSPNLISVDSTEPIETSADVELSDEEKKEEVDILEEKKEKKVVEKSKKEEEKVEDSPESEFDAESDSPTVVKRIGKLTKKMRTAERERDFEKEKRFEAEAKLKELLSKVSDPAKPSKEDFDDEDAYIEALTDWKIENKLKASQKEMVEEVEETDARKEYIAAYEGLDEAMARGKEKYKDFAELTLNKDLILSTDTVQILLDTEIPEEIMYYLASNSDVSEKISGLDPVRAAKEIGKIEVKLSKGVESTVKHKKQSSAPEPISPVKVTATSEKDPNKMSPREYRAWRENSK
jgi:hypothetical protein